jgi:hypothetical protein
MTSGLIVGTLIFLFASWLGEKHALWIPVVVLAAAGTVSLMIG